MKPRPTHRNRKHGYYVVASPVRRNNVESQGRVDWARFDGKLGPSGHPITVYWEDDFERLFEPVE